MLDLIRPQNKHRINFFYVPRDKQNSANLGYCFVNFNHPLFILDFFDQFEGKDWPLQRSSKIARLFYGRHGTLSELKQHFRRQPAEVHQQLRIFDNNEIKLVHKDLRLLMKRRKIDLTLGEVLSICPVQTNFSLEN